MDYVLMSVMITFLGCTFCHTTPEDIKIPVPISSPAEINNLHFDTVNINEHRDVAPLSRFNPKVNLEDTILEVEDLIKSNPKLPRLTRGEIIDILENITTADTKDEVKNFNKTRADGQRAIMVVMPFTAGSAQGDIKDLYTRPPVTHMIGGELPTVETKPKKKILRRKPPSFPNIPVEDDQSNLIFAPSKSDIDRPSDTTASTNVPSTTRKIQSAMIRTHLNVPRTQTEVSIAYNGDDVLITPKATFPLKTEPIRIYQSYHQKYANHRYPDDEITTAAPANGLRIIRPPILNHYDDKYSKPYTVNLKDLQKGPNVGNIFSSQMIRTTEKTIIDDLVIPEHQKSVVKNVGLQERPAVGNIFTNHMTTDKAVLNDLVIPEHLKSVVKDLDLHKRPNSDNYFVNQMMHTTEKTIIDDLVIPEHLKSVVKDLDFLTNADFKQMKPAISNQPNTENFGDMSATTSTTIIIKPMPDISEVADNFSPDMKDLLMNFGLLENPNAKPEVMSEESNVFAQNAEVKPESYMSFKPLPDDTPTRHEMGDFLARFGLGRKASRSQKAIGLNKPLADLHETAHSNLEINPQSLKGGMLDLGFTTKNIKSIKSNNDITDAPGHIFNPTTQNASQEELGKLSKLLAMIRDLDKLNSNITEENLKNIDVNELKDLIGSFNGENFVPLDEQEAPNPLNYDYKIVKSDVKRQENTTVSPTTSTTSTTTTTEEARNPSFDDLVASFGGLPESQVSTTEVITTTRRSGFYYLLDWNSFLEVDDQNGKRVSLRFQPKVGNPKHFRYVTVP